MNRFAQIIAWVCCALLLAGCIQTAPIPGYARVGDVVVIGLGGIHHNALSNYQLTTNDIDAQLTDSSGHVFNLTVVNVFKAFPDYVSKMTRNTVTLANSTDAVPNFDGGWFVGLKIADADNTGVPLALGKANIAVSSPLLHQTGLISEGTYAAQKIEIIGGASAQGNFAQQFSYYGPDAGSVVIRPNNMAALTAAQVGGLFVQIDYTDQAKVGTNPLILPFAHHPYIQVSQSIKNNGNGTGSITAFVMNPYGFVPTANRTQRQSSLQDLTLALQVFTNATPATVKASASINAANSYYIDVNGRVIGNVKPQFF